MALLLFEGSQWAALFDHEVLPRSQRTAMLRRAGSSHDRNLIGTRVSFTKRSHRLLRSITHRSVSFPLLRRPSFVIAPPRVACWVRASNNLLVAVDNGLPRSIIFLSFRTPGARTFFASSPGFLTQKMTELREPLH